MALFVQDAIPRVTVGSFVAAADLPDVVATQCSSVCTICALVDIVKVPT